MHLVTGLGDRINLYAQIKPGYKLSKHGVVKKVDLGCQDLHECIYLGHMHLHAVNPPTLMGRRRLAQHIREAASSGHRESAPSMLGKHIHTPRRRRIHQRRHQP
jgi:hypothetical protein